MASVADLYLTSLQCAMLERAQPIAAQNVKIVVSRLAETVNLLGCARIVWEAERVSEGAHSKRSLARRTRSDSRIRRKLQ